MFFKTPKDFLLELLLKRIEESHDIPEHIELDNTSYVYRINIDGYSIESNTYRSQLYADKNTCFKDGIKLFDKENAEDFFIKVSKIIGKKNDQNKKNREKCKKLKEEMQAQELLNQYSQYISELEGTKKVEGTKEFNEVMKDTKRLQEITREAQEIHNKYKKPFYQIFNK